MGIRNKIGNIDIRNVGGFSWAAYWAAQSKALFDRMEVEGATFALTKKLVYDTTIKALIDNDIWDYIDDIIDLSGDSLLNWKGITTTATKSGNVYLENGVGGYADTTGYIDTNFNPTTHGVNYKQDDAFVGFWQAHDRQFNNAFWGVQDGTRWLGIIPSDIAGTCYHYINSTSGGIKTFASVVNQKGFHIIKRDASNSVKIFGNGTLLKTEAGAASSGLPNANIYLMRMNGNGTPSASSWFNQIGIWCIGGGLSDAKITTLSTIIAAHQAAMGTTSLSLYDDAYVQIKTIDRYNVQAINGNTYFGYDGVKVYMSIDGGVTWPYSKAFTKPYEIEFAYIFDTNTVVFATRKKIYRSADLLTNVTEITMVDEADAPFVYHIPANATYPGNYFHNLRNVKKFYIGATEIMVTGNYGNVYNGAVPTIAIYSLDDGATIKVSYTFGQNPYFTDDGTADGGTGGAALGDAGNAEKVRHIHSITQDDVTEKFYMCTGDENRADPFYETKWFEGEYTVGTDTWVWTKIIDDSSATRYKSMMSFYDGYMYWVADTNGAGETGVWRSTIANIGTPANHERIYTLQTSYGLGIAVDGKIISLTNVGQNTIVTSSDLTNFNLSTLGNNTKVLPVRFRIGMKNADDYRLCDPYAQTNIPTSSRLLIKAK